MSLINDALKRARQSPPRNPQSPFPPLPIAAERPAPVKKWLVPAIVIFLIAAAIFLLRLAVAHHSASNVIVAATAPTPVAATQPAAEVAPPVVVNPPEPLPLNPPDAPKLQGIFYSPAAPAAILDGKMVRPGDHFLNYRVTEITKSTVMLAGADGKAIKLGMAN